MPRVRPEAQIEPGDGGAVPVGDGWLLLNAREAKWLGRRPEGVVYPVCELAQRHGAGASSEVREPGQAYAGLPPDSAVGYHDGWLPER
jgi:hypothetical protein